MIDTRTLLSLFDDEILVRKYLQRFVQDMPVLLQKMRTAYGAQHWNELSIHAHSYKCQMQYIQETDAINLAYELEKNSISSAPDSGLIENLIMELDSRLDKSIEEIHLIIG
ncbi:MAG TPA: Hpt domain-containing protein [Saprospiraceae bacterium]|nr:Hpt domain-containing protein [Saprospiraceae bacterium]